MLRQSALKGVPDSQRWKRENTDGLDANMGTQREGKEGPFHP